MRSRGEITGMTLPKQRVGNEKEQDLNIGCVSKRAMKRL